MLRKEVILYYCIEGPEAVAPAYFLSLLICSPAVGNADFKYSIACLSNLGCDLWFKTEAIFLDHKASEHLATKRLIACFHVCEIQICKHVRK